MRKPMRLLALLGVAQASLAAQDFAPGVLLLARVKVQMRQELDRLPDCTCTETLERYRVIRGGVQMRLQDSVHLEILFSGDRELYAAPGDGHWSSDLHAFIATGMYGDGIFALHLKSVLLSGGPVFVYRGESQSAQQRLAQYDFHVSQLSSGYSIGYAGVSATVAKRGSLWVDPETKDVIRLEIHADEIPSSLPYTDVSTIINYARTPIGDRQVLLPETGELRTDENGGAVSLDRIQFTHCRAFAADSSVSFDAPHQ